MKIVKTAETNLNAKLQKSMSKEDRDDIRKALRDNLIGDIFESKYIDLQCDEINLSKSIMRSHPDQQQLQDLMMSINTIGLINPITVLHQDGMYYLIAGSRRLEAHKKLNRTTVLCRVIKTNTEKQLKIQYAENIDREEVSILEEAKFFLLTKEQLQISNEALGNMYNKSESYITKRLALLGMPEELQIAVLIKAISINAAIIINKCKDIDKIKYLISYIEERKLRDTDLKNFVESIIEQQVAKELDVQYNEPEGQIFPGAYKQPTTLCDVCGKETNLIDIRIVRVCPSCIEPEHVD